MSSAIAEEIEREQHSRRGGLNGGPPGRSTAERLGGARRRLGFARLAGGLVPVVGVLVVALVVAVFFGLHGSGPSSTAPTHGSVASNHGSVELVYLAEPSALAPVVTRGALERTVLVMRERLRALGIGGAHVSVSGANEITVVLPNVRNTAQAEREVGTTAQLSFYDWEANALTPNGKTVASQLQAQDPTAIEISQGSGSLSPGSPGAGSMGLYQAVQLASKQHGWSSPAQLAHRTAVLDVRSTGQRRLRRRRARSGHRAGGRPALPAVRARRQPEDLGGSPARRQRLRGPDLDRSAWLGGPPGDPRELLAPDPDRLSQRAVLRPQGQHRAARQRHHQPAAKHRSQHRHTQHHIRVQLQGQDRVPEPHRRRSPAAATSSAARVSRSTSTSPSCSTTS